MLRYKIFNLVDLRTKQHVICAIMRFSFLINLSLGVWWNRFPLLFFSGPSVTCKAHQCRFLAYSCHLSLIDNSIGFHVLALNASSIVFCRSIESFDAFSMAGVYEKKSVLTEESPKEYFFRSMFRTTLSTSHSPLDIKVFEITFSDNHII